MRFLFALIVLKVFFVLVLLAFRVKAFTFHLCLAGAIYWRFETTRTNPYPTVTVYTVAAGPVSFVVVR